MKYLALFFVLLVKFPAFADLSDCVCQENQDDCKVGALACSGQMTDGKSTFNFSESKNFGPDDGLTPVASIRTRNQYQPPQVSDLSIFGSSCDGHTTSLQIALLLWANTPPNYPVISRDEKKISLKKNESVQFDIKINGSQVHGVCSFQSL